MIEILQIITSETVTPMFVVPFIGFLVLGLVITVIIVFFIVRWLRAGPLGQEDSWLQE